MDDSLKLACFMLGDMVCVATLSNEVWYAGLSVHLVFVMLTSKHISMCFMTENLAAKCVSRTVCYRNWRFEGKEKWLKAEELSPMITINMFFKMLSRGECIFRKVTFSTCDLLAKF